MDFISPFIEPIISHLWDPLARQIRYLFKAKQNVANMMNSMEDLRACRDDLLKEIEDAKRQHKQTTHMVERWLQKVEEVGSEVDGTKLNYENGGCHLFGDYSLNCCLTFKIGKRATHLFEVAVVLKSERDGFGDIATMRSPGRGQALPTQSLLLGLDPYVEQIFKYLTDNSVGVIGIYGMGGAGKTTLLKAVNNLLLVERNLGFEYLMWHVVTREFQLKRLQSYLAKSLGLDLEENNDVAENANTIFDFLKDKNFVLFLDDIWKGFSLLDVGIPDTHSSSSIACSSSNHTKKMQKVILTTRFKDVCGIMGAHKIIKVEVLNKANARCLFMNNIPEWNINSNPGIQSLVDEVIDECAGLPLAVNVIGRAMSTKTTIPEWQDAIASLKKSQAHDILGEEHQMFRTLKFSYDNLQNDDLRKCFLYCSMWPEDYNICKYDVIAYCLGHGLVKDFDDITKAYNKGYCLIEDLKAACLLETGYDDPYEVKMHDVIRDLALWIAWDCGRNQSKWLVKAGIDMEEEHWLAEKWKETEAVSLIASNIKELPLVSSTCPALSFLLLRMNKSLCKIHPNLFQYLPTLTFLDLSYTYIEEIPPSIGMLKMLQHLSLAYTAIKSLPEELGSLSRLRYLDLQATKYLSSLPSGMLSSLTELQVLNLFMSDFMTKTRPDDVVGSNSDGDDDVESNSDGEGRKVREAMIEEMEHLPRGLKGLGIDVLSPEALKCLSELPYIFTWRLVLAGLRGLTCLQLSRNMWRHLQMLFMFHCQDAKVLDIGVGARGRNDQCPLEFLWMFSCSQLEKIVWSGVAPGVFFRRLRIVVLQGCLELKNVSWVLQLPSLSVLCLSGCTKMECVIGGEPEIEVEGTVVSAFSSLKELTLDRLPKLRRICDPIYGFPSLEKLMVIHCPMLKTLPFQSGNANKLQKIQCDDRWWEGLEWDEQCVEVSLECRRSRYIYLTNMPALEIPFVFKLVFHFQPMFYALLMEDGIVKNGYGMTGTMAELLLNEVKWFDDNDGEKLLLSKGKLFADNDGNELLLNEEKWMGDLISSWMFALRSLRSYSADIRSFLALGDVLAVSTT